MAKLTKLNVDHPFIGFEVDGTLARLYRGPEVEFIALGTSPYIEALLEYCKHRNVTPSRYRITIEAIPE